jgi:hypothetical protein
VFLILLKGEKRRRLQKEKENRSWSSVLTEVLMGTWRKNRPTLWYNKETKRGFSWLSCGPSVKRREDGEKRLYDLLGTVCGWSDSF